MRAVATLLLAGARAVDYLQGNPRAAARARAVALVDAIGGASALPDPDVLHTTALDWSAIDEGLLPATRERDDEQRRSRASIEALATVARAFDRKRIVDPCAGRGDVALPLAYFWGRTCCLARVVKGHSKWLQNARTRPFTNKDEDRGLR